MELKLARTNKQYVYSESTSIVAQLAYYIQTYLATAGGEPQVADYLVQQDEILIPSHLQYVDSMYDPESGVCGVQFLDTKQGCYLIGYSGTNIFANKLKDFFTDMQIVLGYPNIETFVADMKRFIITRKKPELEVVEKVEQKLLAFIETIDVDSATIPDYYTSAVAYFIQQPAREHPSILVGHSLGGNIAMLVALATNHDWTITYNSAPLYVVDKGNNFILKIQEQVAAFTGRVIRFVAEDDPLNAISDGLKGCYIGEKIVLKHAGTHGMIHFFAPSVQKEIQKKLEELYAPKKEEGIIMFEKLVNFRDLGGIPTKDGRTLAMRKLYRSGELSHLTSKDIETLEALGLATIVDMRTIAEVTASPNKPVPHTKSFHIDFFAESDAMGQKDTKETADAAPSMENMLQHMGDFDADTYMCSIYADIIANTHAQNGMKEFFRIVREEETAVLWHCFAGKDRTGVSAALLLATLGVEEDAIIEDFLATNALRKEDNTKTISELRAKGIPEEQLEQIETMLYVKAIYLEKALEAIVTLSGSVAGYITDVLGITEENIAKLQAKYLQ